MIVPALGLPDSQKEFKLCIHEKEGMSLGVLVQMLGDIPWSVASLSKPLDNTVRGWPPCLQAVAATCELLLKTVSILNPATLLPA